MQYAGYPGHLQKYICCFNVIKPNYLIQPLSFQFSFPLHFKSKIKKKRFSGGKIVHDYTDMIYFRNLHISIPFRTMKAFTAEMSLPSSPSLQGTSVLTRQN